MITKPQEFFSSTATASAEGNVLIALFDGGGVTVGLLTCSVDAAKNLRANIAACLVNGGVRDAGDDA